MLGNSTLTIGLLSVGILLAFITVLILRSGKISVKIALVWFIPAIAIILLAIFPEIFSVVANSLGFVTISNLVIGFLLLLILFLIMAITIIISNHEKKITLLVQEISILKEKQEGLNTKN